MRKTRGPSNLSMSVKSITNYDHGTFAFVFSGKETFMLFNTAQPKRLAVDFRRFLGISMFVPQIPMYLLMSPRKSRFTTPRAD